jgi:hypothetical protein
MLHLVPLLHPGGISGFHTTLRYSAAIIIIVTRTRLVTTSRPASQQDSSVQKSCSPVSCTFQSSYDWKGGSLERSPVPIKYAPVTPQAISVLLSAGASRVKWVRADTEGPAYCGMDAIE